MIDRTRVRGCRRASLVMAAAMVAGPSLVAGEPASDDVCDPGLARESDNPMAYGPREDRCEGLYRLKVNSDEILVKSWTAWFEDFDPGDSHPLELSWSLPQYAKGQPVRVRATALKPRTFYRMDTRLEESESPWSWPTDLLGRLRLGRADLGVLSWTTTDKAACDDEKVVYLPLGVRQNDTATPSEYRVAVVPGERLLEVFWSLARVEDPGDARASLGEAEPLGYGYYPAGLPTVFTVPAPAREGTYLLSIQAQLRSSGSATRNLCFYHPGTGDAGTKATASASAGGAP